MQIPGAIIGSEEEARSLIEDGMRIYMGLGATMWATSTGT